jgi:hypothetical protein
MILSVPENDVKPGINQHQMTIKINNSLNFFKKIPPEKALHIRKLANPGLFLRSKWSLALSMIRKLKYFQLSRQFPDLLQHKQLSFHTFCLAASCHAGSELSVYNLYSRVDDQEL